MKTSDEGLAFIAGHEGVVLGPYRDSVGVLTIGIGHTAAAGDPDPAACGPIVISEAMDIFRRDIGKFEDRVNKAVKVPMAQHEFDALVSFDFNTGGVFRAKITEHLNAGNKAAARAAFMGWLKPAAIKGRRLAEQHLFASGDYGTRPVPVYTASREKALFDHSLTPANFLAAMHRPKPRPEPIRPMPRPATNPLSPESPWAGLWRAVITALGR